MNQGPQAVAAFLEGRRFAVAGVSRSGNQPANAIFRKLRDGGFEVVPINPHVGVIVVTPPAASADIARQAGARGIKHLWFHRSFGQGSISDEALQACAALGIRPIVGGCPLMYCEPVDVAHRCFVWWLSRQGRVPV